MLSAGGAQVSSVVLIAGHCNAFCGPYPLFIGAPLVTVQQPALENVGWRVWGEGSGWAGLSLNLGDLGLRAAGYCLPWSLEEPSSRPVETGELCSGTSIRFTASEESNLINFLRELEPNPIEIRLEQEPAGCLGLWATAPGSGRPGTLRGKAWSRLGASGKWIAHCRDLWESLPLTLATGRFPRFLLCLSQEDCSPAQSRLERPAGLPVLQRTPIHLPGNRRRHRGVSCSVLKCHK